MHAVDQPFIFIRWGGHEIPPLGFSWLKLTFQRLVSTHSCLNELESITWLDIFFNEKVSISDNAEGELGMLGTCHQVRVSRSQTILMPPK